LIQALIPTLGLQPAANVVDEPTTLDPLQGMAVPAEQSFANEPAEIRIELVVVGRGVNPSAVQKDL
jgi:hypothetical protein